MTPNDVIAIILHYFTEFGRPITSQGLKLDTYCPRQAGTAHRIYSSAICDLDCGDILEDC